jgi:hypothetical protein
MHKNKIAAEKERERIHTGSVCRTLEGDSIPSHIIVRNGRGLSSDQIWIESRKETGNTFYYLYVHEEMGGESGRNVGKKRSERKEGDWGGGGMMGESLTQFALEIGLKSFPSAGYSERRDADIYRLTYRQLCRVWEIYISPALSSQSASSPKSASSSTITEAQIRARSANADVASRAKSEQAQEKRLRQKGWSRNYGK